MISKHLWGIDPRIGAITSIALVLLYPGGQRVLLLGIPYLLIGVLALIASRTNAQPTSRRLIHFITMGILCAVAVPMSLYAALATILLGWAWYPGTYLLTIAFVVVQWSMIAAVSRSLRKGRS